MASNRKKGRSKLPIFVAVVVVMGALVVGGMTVFNGGRSTAKPFLVPSSPVQTTNIKESLAAFQGKVVILDLWATWCGPCRMEIPGFVSLENKYRDRGVEIIGASLDPVTQGRGGRPEAVGPFMKQFGINYTIFLVSSAEAMQGFDAGEGIPTTYIINRQGNVVSRYVGVRSESFFENEIKRLL
jgi:thiol-disulfide isomerase/thioredoxin